MGINNSVPQDTTQQQNCTSHIALHPDMCPRNHVKASQISQLDLYYHLNNLPFVLNQVGMSAGCPDHVIPKASFPRSYPNKLCFHLILINTRHKVGVTAFSSANLSLLMKDS